MKNRHDHSRPEIDYENFIQGFSWAVFFCDPGGHIMEVNPAFLNILGYENKAGAILGNKDLAIFPDQEDRQGFLDFLEQAGNDGHIEVDLKKESGKLISVLMTGSVTRDKSGNLTGYQGIFMDQSSRKKEIKALQVAHAFLKDKVLGYEGILVDQYQKKQMEKGLKEAHDFLSQVIQNSPNVIVATDLKGYIIIMNTVAEETLGYRAQDVIGKMNIEKLYPRGKARELMRLLRSPEYGGTGRLISYPIVNVSRDGTVVEGSLASTLIYDANGNEIACVHIFTDLTERLEMERTLRQIQEKLLQSEKLAAMGRLTSQIAHELNNPLFGIMNTLELMKSEISMDNKRRKVLEMALSETVRLTDLLQKMLSFSKPDQREKTSIDINIILDEILLLHEKQLQERNIRVESDFYDGLRKIVASRDQLRQVFLNMIANSRDAMPDGGMLSVRTRDQGKEIVIEISDTGVGIHEEDIKKIFDAFYTTKDAVKGVGLGLSVCYGVVREHGGDIKVESTPGRGTRFSICFPVQEE